MRGKIIPCSFMIAAAAFLLMAAPSVLARPTNAEMSREWGIRVPGDTKYPPPNPFSDGHALMSACAPDISQKDAPLCVGFMVGVIDAMEAAQAVGATLAGWHACFPNGHIDVDQAQAVAMRFFHEHQDLRKLPASILVAMAEAQAFPCPPGH